MSDVIIENDMLLLSCLIDKDYSNFVELLDFVLSDNFETYGNILKSVFVDKMYDVDKDELIREFSTRIIKQSYLYKILASIVTNEHGEIILTNILGTHMQHIMKNYKLCDVAVIIKCLLNNSSQFYISTIMIFLDFVFTNFNVDEILDIYTMFIDSPSSMNILYDIIDNLTKTDQTINKIKLANVLIRFVPRVEDKIKLTTFGTYIEFDEQTALKIPDIYHKFFALTTNHALSSYASAISFHKLEKIVNINPLFGFGNENNNLARNEFNMYKPHVQNLDNIKKIIHFIKFVFRCSDHIHSNSNIDYVLDMINYMLITLHRDYDGITELSLTYVKYLYDVLITVINGLNGKINNPHIRFSAVKVLYNVAVINELGTSRYCMDMNTVYALINYMRDVKYSSWMFVPQHAKHTFMILKLINLCMMSLQIDKIESDTVIDSIDNDTIIFILLKSLSDNLDEYDNFLNDDDIHNFITPYQTSLFIIIIHNFMFLLKEYFIVNNRVGSDIALMINISCFKLCKFFDKNSIDNGRDVIEIKTNMCIIFCNLIDNCTMNVANIDKICIDKILIETSFKSANKIANFLNSSDYVNYEHNSNGIDELKEEVVDPIFYVPIQTPIMLPNSKYIYDMDHMFVHIRTKGENPQTREKLSISEIVSYNNKSDIVEFIKDYRAEHSDYFSHSKL